MIETKDKEINGSKYSVTQFPAMRALRIQARIIKLLGAPLSFLFIADSNNSKSADEQIPKVLMMLADQLDEKNFDSLVLDLLQSVRKNGMELTKPIIDLEFAGKLNELYLVLQFVLEVNYADFFQENGILKVIGNVIQEAKTKD